MNRLTTDNPVSEMGMVELAHNSCFAKDRNARYRDFETDLDARDFARQLHMIYCSDTLPEDDNEFDEVIMDDLQYGYDTTAGLIALFYRNLWAQADLYETLKAYEDTNLTPEQIKEIDKLYIEKCQEVNELKVSKLYDIENVVGQLNKATVIGADCVGKSFDCIPTFRAIEIVKGGEAE